MMKVKTTYYHNDLTGWCKTLQFYTDIVYIFEKRLAEVVNNNTRSNVLAEVEHFQNQFILQREQFDLLRHDINKQEALVRADILLNKDGEDARLLEQQGALNEKMQLAESIFEETKRSFYRFLSIVF